MKELLVVTDLDGIAARRADLRGRAGRARPCGVWRRRACPSCSPAARRERRWSGSPRLLPGPPPLALIVENGGAIVRAPRSGLAQTTVLGSSIRELVDALGEIAREAGARLTGFSALPPAELVRLTGLCRGGRGAGRVPGVRRAVPVGGGRPRPGGGGGGAPRPAPARGRPLPPPDRGHRQGTGLSRAPGPARRRRAATSTRSAWATRPTTCRCSRRWTSRSSSPVPTAASTSSCAVPFRTRPRRPAPGPAGWNAVVSPCSSARRALGGAEGDTGAGERAAPSSRASRRAAP